MVFLDVQRSDVLAARAQLGEDDVDALLVDRTQTGVGQPKAHPAVLALDPELAALQVRQEPAPGPVVGVGNIVAHHRAFTRYYTNSSHGLLRCVRSRRSCVRGRITKKEGSLTGKRR